MPSYRKTAEFETLTVDLYGQPLDRQRQECQIWVEGLEHGAILELVEIPGGTFWMGAPQTEEGWHPSQSPQHEVTIAPFWIGIYPVTQAQWQAVASLPIVKQAIEPRPACFVGEKRPVEQVSWQAAVEFCDRLSAHTERLYRLPSEAEWEYACRAATTTPFCFGATITTGLANFSGVDWEYQGKICSKGSYGKAPLGIDRRETTEVGSFQIANRFGLHDMHGLVREWCEDGWHPTYENAPTDGTAWTTEDSNLRVLRGGSWNGSPRSCRSAFRNKLDSASHLYDVGFRVVCSAIGE